MDDQTAARSGVLAQARPGQAVLVVDLVDSVPLLQRHETDALARWHAFVDEVRVLVLPPLGLRLVKSLGDGLRIIGPTAPRLVDAVLEMNRRLVGYNANRDQDAQLRLHAGVHVADLVENDLDIYGHGVNVAARLAAHSAGGEILLSSAANEQMLPTLDPATEDLGDLWLKGMEQPLRAYRVCAENPSARWQWPGQSEDQALRATIAILPFESADDSGLNPWLGDLVADELICALSVLSEVTVLSRFSTRAMAMRATPAAEAAPALQADFVLSGRCHRLGEHLIVHAEVFDARRGEVVQRLRESAPLASLLSAESPLLQSLLAHIGQAVLSRQLDLARRCALPHLAGYTLLLGGVALMHRLSRRDFERAGQLLEHLVERWPRLPTPMAWLARWHLFSVLQGWSVDVAASSRAAHESSQRALGLDAESSVALAVAGSVRIGLSQDVDGGVGLYEEALRANPNDSFAWMLLGTAHAFKGEGPDAIQASARAVRLSPLDPMHFMYDCHAAAAALAADDANRALALAQRSMRANSMHLSTYRVLAIAQMLCSDGGSARDTIRRLRVLDPRSSVEQFLRTSPSAAYPIGQRLAQLLAEAGLPRQGS